MITISINHHGQVERIGCFDSADEAAFFRDHSPLAYENTKLEILDPDRDKYTSVATGENTNVQETIPVDYSHAKDNGWTLTPEGWLFC